MVTPALAGPVTLVASGLFLIPGEQDQSRESSKLRQRDTARFYEGKPTVGIETGRRD